jgi:pimeloyl-ACP methyl ester carboxylesterase
LRNRSSAISRLLYRGFLVSGLLVFALGGYRFVDPVGFRTTVFQPAREILFLEREIQPLSHWDKVRMIDIPPADTVILPSAGGNDVKIVADFRVPKRTGGAPAILLLHGSSPWGRKNGLIQYLSYRLANEGWVVLAPDQRGFGDTEDPKMVDDPAAWDIKGDVGKCIEFLLSNPLVDRNRVFILGHSMGAGHAMEAALENAKVRGLILIGPPRFLEGAGQEKGMDWVRMRFSADRGLEKPAGTHLVAALEKKMDIAEISKGALSRPGHKPILLIDGETEGMANREFLSNVASGIRPPMTYVTLPGTGHYVGVYNLFRSRRVYYRSDLFDSFMKVFFEFTRGIPFSGGNNG